MNNESKLQALANLHGDITMYIGVKISTNNDPLHFIKFGEDAYQLFDTLDECILQGLSDLQKKIMKLDVADRLELEMNEILGE